MIISPAGALVSSNTKPVALDTLLSNKSPLGTVAKYPLSTQSKGSKKLTGNVVSTTSTDSFAKLATYKGTLFLTLPSTYESVMFVTPRSVE